jgi:2-oxoisovalerate dehydrogenase E2 component (dihydrolipoyl transacylase)
MPTGTLTTITMPQLGESVVEGMVGQWLKQVGDRIEKYDSLVELETDKASAELPAPVAGVLAEILVEPGTTVAVGTGLCRIQEQGSASVEPDFPEPVNRASRNGGGDTAASMPASSISRLRDGEVPDEATMLRTRSSPVVRRIAEEHGIEIAAVEGTGTGGRVTKRDILAFLAEHADQPVSAPAARPEPAIAGPMEAVQRTSVTVFPGDEVIPVSPMRRAIAEHMVRSERTAPHATVVMEVDMTGAVAWRTGRKEEFRRREGVDLTYLSLVMKAVTLALRDHPRLNAVWDEERIIHRKAINIGVAVALEDGLVVPVIKNADRLSVAGLAIAIAEMAERARSGGFVPDDLAGGTFTLNNPGTFGSLVSTPILVQPQVAILSTEAIIKRPVVVDDMIGIRSMMNLSLSIDHRALDGLAAARFLQQVKAWLEDVSDNLPLY